MREQGLWKKAFFLNWCEPRQQGCWRHLLPEPECIGRGPWTGRCISCEFAWNPDAHEVLDLGNGWGFACFFFFSPINNSASGGKFSLPPKVLCVRSRLGVYCRNNFLLRTVISVETQKGGDSVPHLFTAPLGLIQPGGGVGAGAALLSSCCNRRVVVPMESSFPPHPRPAMMSVIHS